MPTYILGLHLDLGFYGSLVYFGNEEESPLRKGVWRHMTLQGSSHLWSLPRLQLIYYLGLKALKAHFSTVSTILKGVHLS